MKKKVILMCIAGALALTAAIGSTLAGFYTEPAEAAVIQISTRSLGIDIQDAEAPLSAAVYEEKLKDTALPGEKITFSRNVCNNTRNGYELYTRVTICKRWEKSGNDELDASKIHLCMDNEQFSLKGVELTEENRETIEKAGWLLWYQDDEQVILYYKYPLKAAGEGTGGEETTDFISAVSIDGSVDNRYAEAAIELEFRVDAVQAVAAEAAMISEWGVYPEFSGDGTILSIAE